MRAIRVTGRDTATSGLPASIAAVVLATCLTLGGCDSAQTDAASASGAPTVAQPRPPKASREDMVAAVSAGQGEGLVGLKFSLAKRPVLGEPVEIELAVTPAVALERVMIRLQAPDGLDLVTGGESEQFEDPPAGEPIGHKLTLVARADGIFGITAVVLADSATESVARTFTIPIIAGKGMSDASAVSGAPAEVVEPKSASTGP